MKNKAFLSHILVIITVMAFSILITSPLPAGDAADETLKKSAELKNPKISNPSLFKKDYKLGRISGADTVPPGPAAAKLRALKKAGSAKSAVVYAEVAVNILGPNFKPVKAYVLRDVTDLDNTVTLWDGRDSYGRELPAGNYYAQLSVLYSDGAKETKTFKFEKK